MNPSTALATVLVDELVRHGVRDAVLCPGSRSAPLAYAMQEADRAGRLRLHVRVDERSAAFLALGLAKLTRRTVPVVTTSGTAVANLHPAVLEAHHAQVPLLLLTADRPPELRGTGANQTTDQRAIFGDAVRWEHELGAPEADPAYNAVWRSVVARACAAAEGRLTGWPGPVHVNLPLREPLTPDLPGQGRPWPGSLDGRPGGAPWVRLPEADPALVFGGGGAGGPVADLARTLMIVGDLPHPAQARAAVDVATRCGWPVIAEPFGELDRSKIIPHGPLLLTADDWVAAHLPERALVVGRPTLSRATSGLLRTDVVVETVTTDPTWNDPGHLTSRVYPWGALLAAQPGSRSDADEQWRRDWMAAGAALASAAAQVVWQVPSSLAAARTIFAELPKGAVLFVGSSNAVRDLDLTSTALGNDVTVVASRGLAGIDGCVSTAVGIALTTERPAYALLGDLTFLHDAAGLVIGPDEPVPDLTILVVNDDGGGIFTLLEYGHQDRAADFERIFGTPTRVDLGQVCASRGIPHVRVAGLDHLRSLLFDAPRGLRVVEIPVSRAGHREAHATLRTAAAAALADHAAPPRPSAPMT